VNLGLDAVGFGFQPLQAGLKSCQFIFEVFDFEGQFTANDAKPVNAAVDQLEVIERPELFLCARGFGLLGHQDT